VGRTGGPCATHYLFGQKHKIAAEGESWGLCKPELQFICLVILLLYASASCPYCDEHAVRWFGEVKM
jgi:hypothetical protein